ncbi:MAG: SDR family NAD(P)-dependent oxidoreductase [Sphingomonadaceae bacterium]|nr:SDR family NAD(P)-dependent oxidoreductase [Sphingomonadaceae bacterium]
MKIEAGQVAVITGGASGIGLGLAERLARAGVRLVLADIEEGALNAAVSRLSGTGAEAIGVVTDVSRSEDFERLRDRALAAFGRVDIVVNNAGVVSAYGPLWEATLDDWRWVTNVNLWGVINGIRAFVPLLVAQGSGHVVNTASMAGLAVIPYNGVYNATKHAVVSITETLRGELDDCGTGVGATVVCPGIVPTKIHEAARNRPGGATEHEATNAKQMPKPASNAPSAALSVENVAEQIVAAIERNHLYLATNPGSFTVVEHRIARILEETAAPLR